MDPHEIWPYMYAYVLILIHITTRSSWYICLLIHLIEMYLFILTHMAHIHQEQHSIRNLQVVSSIRVQSKGTQNSAEFNFAS